MVIRLCSLNAQSVCNKAEYISDLISDLEAHICAITESWLSPSRQDNITLRNLLLPGYMVQHVPRRCGKGGGVALVNRDNLSIDFKKASFTSFDVIEALLSTGNNCVRLVHIYLPPSSRKHGRQPVSSWMSLQGTWMACQQLVAVC